MCIQCFPVDLRPKFCIGLNIERSQIKKPTHPSNKITGPQARKKRDNFHFLVVSFGFEMIDSSPHPESNRQGGRTQTTFNTDLFWVHSGFFHVWISLESKHEVMQCCALFTIRCTFLNCFTWHSSFCVVGSIAKSSGICLKKLNRKASANLIDLLQQCQCC